MRLFGLGLYKRGKKLWQTISRSQGVHDHDEHDASDYWTTYIGGTTQLLSKADKDHIVVNVIEDQVSGKVVLDLGCGFGRANLFFDFKEYHGIDTNERMLFNAIKLNANKNNTYFHKGNGRTLRPFSDQYFDVVFSSTVYVHLKVSTVKGYAPEIYRVLKPGGFFLVNFPKQRNLDVKRVFHDFEVVQLPDWRNDDVFKCIKGDMS